MRRIVIAGLFLLLGVWGWAQTKPDAEWKPRLILEIVDADTGRLTPARFEIRVDGERYEPEWIGPHGVRFASVHYAKRQTYIATYARGTGVVELPLPHGATEATVHVTKGFEYQPVSTPIKIDGDPVRARVRLKRGWNLREEGWVSADAHLHYDRPEPAADRDWFHMLAGDGLDVGQFMVLKGGMVPGVWARQYAYGRFGENTDGVRTLIPGMEYRDRMQGHLLLFGVDEVIEPIIAGTAEAPHNWPPFQDVLDRARLHGGLVGPAHGGTLGVSPTAMADALAGRADFWEIGNAHLWELDDWYTMLNVGKKLPPMAGTDLPNNPDRETWQPFLGSIRTYAKTGGDTSSEAWNAAVLRGETFVTSGPLIRLNVNGVEIGGTVKLPREGATVAVEAEVRSVRPTLRRLEIVHNGKVVARADQQDRTAAVRQMALTETIAIGRTSWIAVRALGDRIDVIGQPEVAHTSPVWVEVGSPVEEMKSPADAQFILERLTIQEDLYRREGSYPSDAARDRMLEILRQGRAAALSRAGTVVAN